MLVRVLLLSCLAFSGAGFGVDLLKEVPHPIFRAFVPQGFDTNDSIEIMVGGVFPSTCYKTGDVFTEVSGTTIRINLDAYVYPGKCIPVAIPFYQVVHLGLIRNAGDYTIEDATSGRKLGTIRISPEPTGSGHGTDNSLYAPLTDAYLLTTQGRPYLAVMGHFSNDCMGFKNVEMEVYGDVLVVLPRVGIAKNRKCRNGHFPFHKAFKIPKELPGGSIMLHVRSATGRAVNKIIVGQTAYR